MMRMIFRLVLLGFFAVMTFLKFMERRHWVTEKRWAFILTTYMSIFTATATLYVSAEPEGQNPPTIDGWVLAIILSLALWVIDFPIARWIYRVLKSR